MVEILKLTPMNRDATRADSGSVAGAVEIPPRTFRFVEFFGLPGIGKTTISRTLVEKLRDAGVAAEDARTTWGQEIFLERQLHRIGRVAPKLIRPADRRFFMRVVRFVAEGGQVSAIDQVRRTWDLCSVAAFILGRRSRGASLTLMDQGVLQGLWSILLTGRGGRTSETWIDILSAISPEDILFVYLRGRPDTARARLANRGDRSSRLQRQKAGEEGELWSDANRLCREMTNDLMLRARVSREIGALVTFDVDGCETPEEIAEEVCAAVLRAVDDRAGDRQAAKA